MENNLRDALQYLVGIGEEITRPEVLEIEGKTYCTKKLSRYDSRPKASPITGCSLTSLVDFIKGNKEDFPGGKMIVHITAPDEVRFYSSLDKERDRETLFVAKAKLPDFNFDYKMSQESFIIGIQSCFVQNEDAALILKVAGNVENKSVAAYGDDGTTQRATIKQGVVSKADVIVPNPVTLIPYRTFLEIKQVETKFVFRISEGRDGNPEFKLVEADGGAWKYEAMQRVQLFLASALEEELDNGEIAIIA